MTDPTTPVPESTQDSAAEPTPGEVGEPPAGDDPAASAAPAAGRRTGGSDQASTSGDYDGYQRL